MDAHALLSSQGWRGKGHSLHATDDSIGLAKPLLLNRKDNTKGLGQKAHFTSDTWWMNAFDEQLRGLDTSEKGRVTQTVTQGRLNQVEKVSGGKWMLYASFVRGGFLEGTIRAQLDNKKEEDKDEEEEESGASTPESEETPSSESERENRSRGTVKVKEVKERGETKEERRARRAAKKARKAARESRRKERAARKSAKGFSSSAEKGTGRKESKEKRRARGEAKKAKREARKAKKGESG